MLYMCSGNAQIRQMDQPKIITNFRLSKAHRAHLDAWASAHHMTRTRFLEKLLTLLPAPPPTLQKPAEMPVLSPSLYPDTP